ncbi:hypothetical protein DE146DRAFT_399733 [Phaeosphaeria sp. MPI-PUGE-AT-0046c]|nr:hypothetical protein DE146DRAFT_399733 [Phaeosphaeria sp. MPI-PUGE-AT-0046c]
MIIQRKMGLPSNEIPYDVPARFETIKAACGDRSKTANREGIRQWQNGVRPGTLAEKSLWTERPVPLSPTLGKRKKSSWKKLVKTLHSGKRYRLNDMAFVMELRSETDRLDSGSDAVSLTFKTARSGMTVQEEDGCRAKMPVSRLPHSVWEEQHNRNCTSASNGNIEALPTMSPYMLRKERIVQQTDMAMDPAGMVLYDFLGFAEK